MKHGPFIFLGLLFCLALSWLGMIAIPQTQLGNEQPTNVPPANVIYPAPHSGGANLGLEVYRANGCAYCHTQVVRQEGVEFRVVLTNPGTNLNRVADALLRLRPELPRPEADRLVGTAPKAVFVARTGLDLDTARKALTDAGAELNVQVAPLGADIRRGWGTRLTVAHDYLYDTPLMLGVARLGPDLTNVGLRRPDRAWHLMHLYNPRLVVPGSLMPQFPFLFEKRQRGSRPSPDALPVPGEEEIIPTRAAEALVTYLVNLRADVPLFEAPGPQLTTPSSGGTNAPANPGSATNAAPVGATNSATTNRGGAQ
jgi:cbb3-type cytochrome oxidase cytochrome c subunit